MTCPFCGSPAHLEELNVYDVMLPTWELEADACCDNCGAHRREADGHWVLISERAPGVNPEA